MVSTSAGMISVPRQSKTENACSYSKKHSGFFKNQVPPAAHCTDDYVHSLPLACCDCENRHTLVYLRAGIFYGASLESAATALYNSSWTKDQGAH